MRSDTSGAIILFDGVCNFCNASVQFILKRDASGYFHFTSQQGSAGQQLLHHHGVPSSLDSIVLIEDGKLYYQSDAALRICKHLNGMWKLVAWLLLIPKPIRNFFYAIIAKHRYRWFGKSDSCMLPKPEHRSRFLDESER